MSAFIPPESQEHNETCLEEGTNAGRLGQEAEHETEVGLGMQSEDGPEIGQQQLIEDQSLCHEDLQIPQMTPPQMRPLTPQGEPRPSLQQSTRKRWPTHVFTYLSFGRPTYESRPTVGVTEAQPLQCCYWFHSHVCHSHLESNAHTHL